MAVKLISNNKKAYHDYFVIDKYECGIELKGTEVKSLRKGSCAIKDGICRVINKEVFIIGMHISPYERGNIFNVDSERTRKLLLHKKEIIKIEEELKLKGYTLIPLQVYFKDSKVKLEIGVCKGKKIYDKREDIKEKNIKRNIERKYKGASIKV